MVRLRVSVSAAAIASSASSAVDDVAEIVRFLARSCTPVNVETDTVAEREKVTPALDPPEPEESVRGNEKADFSGEFETVCGVTAVIAPGVFRVDGMGPARTVALELLDIFRRLPSEVLDA